jgi:hypothetical protein
MSARVEAAGNKWGAHQVDGKANSFMSDLQHCTHLREPISLVHIL